MGVTVTDVEVRDYAAGDESHIATLFRAAFGSDLTLPDWRWRYLANPVDRPRILLAWAGDQLVAHYAVSPVELYLEGARRLCALSMTTMTHPGYQGRGLFARLASGSYERLASDGYHLVYGFPNRHSHAGFVGRLGWRNRGYVPQLELAADPRADAPSLQISPEPTASHAELVDRPLGDEWVQPVRDLRYLRWRYHEHPSAHYQFLELLTEGSLAAYAIVKLYEGGLDVLEFAYRTPDTASQLAAGLQRHAAAAGLHAVRLWLSLDEPAYSPLERLGMVPRAPITFFGSRRLDGLSADDGATPWLLRMGLSDVY